MSEEIVLQVLVDENGDELDIHTPYVVRTVTVTREKRIPLYVSGTLKSTAELAELGLSVKSYTQADLDAKTYASYYEENPTLAERVKQYAALLTSCGLDATATSDQISAAISAGETSEAEKTAAGASLLTLIHDIEINYNEVEPGEGLTAWAAMPKLIAYLPPEPEEA